MKLIVLAMATFLFGTVANAKKIQVVASFSVLAALSEEILTDQAEVVSLIRVHSDPHHFEPSVKDIQKLKNADLIVKNGLQFEPWMDRLLKSQNLESKAIELTKGLNALPLPGTQHGRDPHAWLSAENALIYASNLRERLKTIKELDQLQIDKNFSNFQKRIQKLILEMTVFKNQIKGSTPTILVTHESLSYLGLELGIKVTSVHSFNISDFDSGKKVSTIYQLAKEKKISAAFAERSVSSPLFDRIVKEGGIRMGEALYTESVPNITSSQAFSEMLNHNVHAILNALRVNP